MKSILISGAAVLATMLTACAQTNVPEAARHAFEQKFPNAKSFKWDQEKDNEFEAEFKRNGKEMSANFNTQGKWMETETEMEENELPPAINQTIASEFGGYYLEEVAMVKSPEMAEAYEVEMEKGETTMEVIFSAGGKILKQKSEEEAEEGNEED